MQRRTLLIATAMALGASGVQAQNNRPIKIGTFNPITGPAAVIGDPETKAVRLWVKITNAGGGINGRMLELYEYDTQSKTALAVSFMKRLIETDRVDLVVGGGSSGEALAAAPIADSAGMPFVAMATTSKLVRPLKPWVFKVAADEYLTVEASLVDMKKRGAKKIAMLTSNSAFGVSGREAARELVSKNGLDLVADEQYGDQDNDVVPQLNKIKGVQPDATFVYGIGAGVALATKTFRRLAIPGLLYLSTGNATDRFLELAGDAANGTIQGTVPLPILHDLPAQSQLRKVMETLDEEYSREYKVETPGFAATGFDGFMIAASALRGASDPFNKEIVRKALEDIKELQLINGNFSYSDEDHGGLSINSVYMVEVRDGRFRWAEALK